MRHTLYLLFLAFLMASCHSEQGIPPEELARRDLGLEDCEPEDYTELSNRMEDYLDEFDKNGLGSINIDIDN